MKSTHGGRGARLSIGRFLAIAVAAGSIAVTVLPAASANAASRKVVVSAQTIGSHGKVLVSNGKALYVLVAPGTCTTKKCLSVWPPLTLASSVTSATAGHGVQQSKLGTTTGMAGAKQVTYNGQAIYWFKNDKKGQVKGNVTDKWGKWTVVVVGKPSSSSGGSGGSGSTSNSGSGGSNAGSGGVSF
jgi:predicted lipoprotein with Yx(FWY)xxD motif